jgi:hypothetical protein
MTLCVKDADAHISHSDADIDVPNIIRKLFPHASSSPFVDMLLLQRKIQATIKPTGYRWTPDIIRLCLTLHTRSPQGYEDLRSSDILKLPTPKHLALYKNAVNTDAGIHPDLIAWMFSSARDNKLSVEGWHGGIVLDEMKIQEDLQMIRSGSDLKMVGFVDMGQEADLVQVMKRGTREKQLADHVLQMQFIGSSGFRFFCGYLPTRSAASATDIHINFWNAVDIIESYGFSIDYVGMDGGESNRQFLNLNFPNATARKLKFVAKSPVNRSKNVIFIMDYSHVAKKLRNNLYASGTKGTRHLILPTGQSI